PGPLLALDLTGTFAFGLNGALTAVRAARLDVVGVVVLGMITALGGGFIRDVLIDSLPPATLLDWRYYTLAAAAGELQVHAGSVQDRTRSSGMSTRLTSPSRRHILSRAIGAA
ncbi:trimeric intracellular cation channel family protein, partial [Streptomyces sp. NPDC017615]